MRTTLACVLVLLAVGSCADRDHATSGDAGSAPRITTDPVAPAGVDQARHELAPILRRDAVGLTTVTAPDGSLMMNTNGRFGSAVVVRRNADGTTTKTCVDDVDHAVQLLSGPAPLTQPGKEVR